MTEQVVQITRGTIKLADLFPVMKDEAGEPVRSTEEKTKGQLVYANKAWIDCRNGYYISIYWKPTVENGNPGIPGTFAYHAIVRLAKGEGAYRLMNGEMKAHLPMMADDSGIHDLNDKTLRQVVKIVASLPRHQNACIPQTGFDGATHRLTRSGRVAGKAALAKAEL